MKKSSIIIICLFFITFSYSQVAKTVNVLTAGNLNSLLTLNEKRSITNLKIEGNIDARDFKILRDSIPLLSNLDLSTVKIKSYEGLNGPISGIGKYGENEIPYHAFQNNNNYSSNNKTLTAIVLPSNLYSIGGGAFFSCSGLKSIEIPNTVVSIGESSFRNCTSLSNVTLGNSIKSIGNESFQYCNFSNINIPNSVIYLGAGAFAYCSLLKNVTFSNALNAIQNVTFKECINLNNVVIPNSVIYIGNSSFGGCKALTDLTFGNSVKIISSGAFGNCEGLTELIIPNSVTSIGNSSFSNCKGIKNIILGNSVSKIENYAFSSCTSLKTLTISNSLRTINDNPFTGCTSLTTIYSNTLTPTDLINGSIVFENIKTNNGIIYVPYGTKDIYKNTKGWKDFNNIVENQYSLSVDKNSISISHTSGSNASIKVNSNGNWSVSCDQSWLNVASNLNDSTITLTAQANSSTWIRKANVTISIPGIPNQIITLIQSGLPVTLNVTAGNLYLSTANGLLNTISSLVVNGTLNAKDFKTMRDSMPLLSELDLSNSRIIGYNGYVGPSNFTTSYPANEIPNSSFLSNSVIGNLTLTSIILPSTVIKIGNEAFSYCKSLKNILLPNTLQTIGSNCFSNCSQITDIVLPNSLISIEQQAFLNSGITNIILPNSVMKLGEGIFYGCKELKNVILSNSIKIIPSNIFGYCTRLKKIDIPSLVTSIESSAFENCGITQVTMSNSVTIIGSSAFSYCSNLKNINLSHSLKKIEHSTFQYCVNLENVIIPNSVKSIGNNAFLNCVKFNSITIPFSVNEIIVGAFTNCSGLYKIYADMLIPPSGAKYTYDEIFNGINTNSCVLYVPKNTLKLYQEAIYWKKFINIIENPYSLNIDSYESNLKAEEGSKDSINVNSKGAWVATCDQPWLNITYSATNENGKIILTAQKNSTTSIRSAIITVSTPDVPSRYITVKQLGEALNVNVIPGGLFTSLTSEQLANSNSLLITGKIDARDFKTIRDYMPSLMILDLKDVTIEAYSGSEGTLNNSYNYNANEIPENAFYNNSSISSIKLPTSVLIIRNSAFRNCLKLSNITIPDKCFTIQDFSFYNCIGLKEVIFGNALKNIMHDAFYNCKSLTYLVLTDSITTIESSAFRYCTGLISVVLGNSVATLGSYTFAECQNLSILKMSNSLTSIGSNSFDGCTKLSDFKFSNSINSIGSSAFNNCTGIRNIILPASLKSIKEKAFYTCSGLLKITVEALMPLDLSQSLPSFNTETKTNCILQVPHGAKDLYQVFPEWKDFVNIVENPHYLFIENNNEKLSDKEGSQTVVYISSSVNWTTTCDQNWLKITPETGMGNDSIKIIAQENKDVKLRNAIINVSGSDVPTQTINITQFGSAVVVKIEPGGLYKSISADTLKTLTNLVIKGNIDARDFKTMRDSMPQLSSLDLESSTIKAYIGNKGTNSLINNYLENEIPSCAFYYYSVGSLQNLKLPINIKSIGSFAFNYCKSLSKINFPDSLSSIGVASFGDCNSLKNIRLNDNLIKIDNYAFQYSGITELIMPNTVNYLGEDVFRNCANLKHATISNSIKEINFSLFNSCVNLESILIPNTLTSFNSNLLNYCLRIKTLTIPESVKYIKTYSNGFLSCLSLAEIYADAKVPIDLNSSTSVFYGVNKNTCILYVPTGSKSLYKEAYEWKNFVNIVETSTRLELNKEKKICIFPNPTRDFFCIKDLTGINSVIIFDLLGNMVFSQKARDGEIIRISDLSKGLYLVRINTSEGIVDSKLLIE